MGQRRIIAAAIVLALIIPFGSEFWAWHYIHRWGIVTALGALGFTLWIGRRVSWIYALAYLCLALSAIIQFGSANAGGQALTPLYNALGKSALYQMLLASGALWCLAVAPTGWATEVRQSLTILVGIGSLWTIACFRLPEMLRGAYTGNPSMHGCLLASLAFFLPWYAWPLPILAIFFTNASVPVGVLAVTTVAYVVAYRLTLLPIAVVCGLLLLAGGYTFQGHMFFVDSGRFEIWREVYDAWYLLANHWTGWGAGSVQVHVPILQAAHGAKGNFFIFMHNEWLQQMFELGYIGLGCMVLAYVRMLITSVRQPAVFAALCGFGAMAVFNYPLHLPIHATVLLCLVYLAEKTEGPTKVQAL